jgi:predicted P-loop ATPase
MADLLQELARLPDHWAFVAVGANKRAYQEKWADNPLSKAAMAAEITAGRAHAIGVHAGPASGGIVFVDHDGITATAQLERLGIPLRSLPKSWAMTSGRDGRFQIIYSVPEQFWPALRNRRFWHTGDPDPATGKPTKILGPDGKAEQIDLRWSRHYSVVAGRHPETTGYRWLKGRGPGEQDLGVAPMELIELLLEEPEPDPTPLLSTAPLPAPPGPGPGPMPLLDFISKASRQLIESGGTPGSWNDDQLRLALDLRGTEEWIRSQGHQPDITASQAFALHIQAAASKAKDFDERKAWRRFDGADGRTPSPSTPDDKLHERLRFHTRHSLPLLPPRPQAAPQLAQPQPSRQPPPPPQQQPTAQGYAPSLGKPIKLEAAEVLAMLRDQAAGGRLRYNTFTQLIELDGAVLEGAERFYLSLADQGFKVAKEVSLDCLIQVARENLYDPVRLYLEHVEATIQPAYIGGLATAYLRPEDAALGEPTLYDHMLKATLIAAVRRAFVPGCKHDEACVLTGGQGLRKSSFWKALGGPFFDDSLGDLSTKDDLMVLHRSWIMEWAELDQITSKKHAGHIKAFLSRATDTFRVPYGKATESFPRRGIIVGSANRQHGLLVDDENRRFWIIPVTRTKANPIDTGTLMAERDAIWAGAVAAFRAGEPNHLPYDLLEQVDRENEAYVITNPWEPAIAQWLAQRMPGEPITTEGILKNAVEKPTERQTRADQMAVADILRLLGYERRRVMVGGQRCWRWFETG